VVVARFTQQGDDRTVLEASFIETADAGIYLSSPVAFPEAGRYRLVLRDQTYRQEEARAELNFEVGGETPKRSYIFVFPPTATGGVNVGTWILWVVLLPLAVAVAVTLWVLLSPTKKGPTQKTQT
jgi:hypothetical protein